MAAEASTSGGGSSLVLSGDGAETPSYNGGGGMGRPRWGYLLPLMRTVDSGGGGGGGMDGRLSSLLSSLAVTAMAWWL